jgi:hypothetical protein
MTYRRLLPVSTSLILLLGLSIPGALVAAGNAVPVGEIAQVSFTPENTVIQYAVSGWPHHTNGVFRLSRGTIFLNPADGSMRGEIVVDAASGNSGESLRDARMRSSILESDRYPDIVFEPRHATAPSASTRSNEFDANVTGIMLLHGASHTLAIAAHVHRNGDSVSIDSSFSIPYVAWGLKDPSILMFKVDKQVQITVHATAAVRWIKPAEAPGT